MGTINYGSSNYITLGAPLQRMYDFENDAGFMEEARAECERRGISVNDYILEEMQINYEADEDNARYIMDKYSFWYYDIRIKYGYYEGFWIDIENNFGIAYDCWEDKREAQKEITQIRKMLLEQGALSVKSAVIVTKEVDRSRTVAEADWTGFRCSDRYLVGYGLDSNEEYRNLPFIGALD